MKKLLVYLSGAVLIVILGSYLLIPSDLTLQSHNSLNSSGSALLRRLNEGSAIKKWWPGPAGSNTASARYSFNGTDYVFRPVDMTLMAVILKKGTTTLQTRLYIFKINKDSTNLLWIGHMQASRNPLTRIRQYLQIKSQQTDMDLILNRLSQFYVQPANLYGSVINIQKVVDTAMIAIFATSKGYPTDKAISAQIVKLQAFALQHAALQSGYPMVNVTPGDSVNKVFEVALPVNKILAPTGGISPKRLPRGKILETEVKGGISQVEKAMQELKNYGIDHQFNVYVIPYYSLVTDRTAEPDSSKWITKVYCPIF